MEGRQPLGPVCAMFPTVQGLWDLRMWCCDLPEWALPGKTKKHRWILVRSFQLAPFPKSPASHLFSVLTVSFISSFPFPASHQFVVVLTIFNFRSLQNPFYICSDSCHFCQISSRISSLLVVLVLLLVLLVVVLLVVVVAFRTDLLLFLFGFIQSFSLNLFISLNFPVLRLNCFLLFYF